MSDPAPEVEAAAAPAVTTPKKAKATKKVAGEGAAKKSPKPKGEKKVASHPPTAQLVIDAVTKLNEKKGSSLIAIKKSIADSYKTVDIARLAPFIRKYLKSAVEKGTLVQVKGKGAMGSFKLAVKPKVVKAKKPAGEKKPRVKKVKAAGEGKVKKPAAKKAVKPKSPKKAASPKKAGAVKVKTVKAVAPKAAKAAPAVKAAKPKKAAEKKPKAAKAAAAKPKAIKTKLPKKLVAAKPAKKAASPKKVAAKK